MTQSEQETQRTLFGIYRAAQAQHFASSGCGGVASLFALWAVLLQWGSWILALIAMYCVYKWLTWGTEKAMDEALFAYDQYTITCD